MIHSSYFQASFSASQYQLIYGPLYPCKHCLHIIPRTLALMKLLARLVTALLLCAASLVIVHAADSSTFPRSSEWIVGSYEGRIGTSSRFSTIAISCELSRTCKIVFRAVSPDGPPSVEMQNFRNASPSTTLKFVNNALSYARDKLRKGSKPSPNTDDAFFREQALPFLESDAELEQCIDINPDPNGGPDAYFVVCKPARSLWSSPTVLLFATVLSGCGPAFCRYAILPLHSIQSANTSLQGTLRDEAAQRP